MDESGKQHYLDATVAYKRAVLNCIHYLSKFGYTKEQVQCCASVVACAAGVPVLHWGLKCTAGLVVLGSKQHSSNAVPHGTHLKESDCV